MKSASGPAAPPGDATEVSASLVNAREALATLVLAFLRGGEPVPAGNTLYRFEGS